MLKKISFAGLYAGLYTAVAYIFYFYGDSILRWLQHTDQVLLVMAALILLALFPIIPYPLVGGVIGAAFGPILGTFIIWFASSVASILMFVFVRYGYRDWGEKLLHGNKKLSKATSLFEKNAFLAVLFSRLLPVVPSVVINIYSALSRISFFSFALASSLGKIPVNLLISVVGDRLLRDPAHIVLAVGIYGGFLLVILTAYRWWQKSNHSRKGNGSK